MDRKLERRRRWIILSGDRRITRNKAEYHAFRNSNLVGFFPSTGLCKASIVRQMERILGLWSAIERQSDLVQGGAMFELPTTSSRLRQL